MAERFPQGTSHAGEDGDLPIQIFLAREEEEVEDDDESSMKELLERLYQATPTSILLKTSVLSSANTDAKVEWLVEKNPALCQVPNKFGDLPLHDLLSCWEVSCSALEQVVIAYPQAMRHQGRYGETPLHRLLSGEFRPDYSDVVKMFVKHCPEAATIENENGELPIHLAMGSYDDLSTNRCLDALYGAYPEGLTTIIKDDKNTGKTSLHVVGDPENAIWCIQKHPELCRIANNLGELPLHIAAKDSMDVEALQVMVEAYPEALQKPSQHGDLPLHASGKSSDASNWRGVFQLLFDQYPQAALVKDTNGDLPIQLFLRKRCFFPKGETVELLDKLQALSPQCLHAMDNNGNTILHLADYAVKIKWILARYPELCKIPNQDGDLPLHLLKFVYWGYGDCVTAIRKMIAAYPKALQISNKMGQLPLHKAGYCRHKSILKSMINKYPQAVSEKDHNGRLPIHCFLTTGGLGIKLYDLQCLQLLHETYPEGLAVVDKFGNTALHLAHDNIRLSWVLEQFSDDEICHYNIPNQNGEYPFHLHVSKKISYFLLRRLMVGTSCANQPDTVKGNTPLHNAITAGTSLCALRTLLEVHAPAAQHANKEGKLPLHLFCQLTLDDWLNLGDYSFEEEYSDGSSCYEDFVEMLDVIIKNFPDGLTMYDQSGYLPVHHACSGGHRMSTIEKLLPPRHGQVSTTNTITSSNSYEVLPATKSGVPLLFLACEGINNSEDNDHLSSDDAVNTIFQLVLLSLDLFASANRSRNDHQKQMQLIGRKRALECNRGSGSQPNSDSKR